MAQRGAVVNSRLVVGIDPGRNGGICALIGHGIVLLVPMPETLKEIKIVFENLIARYGRVSGLLIEQLSTCPRFNRTAIMTSARHLGGLEGIVVALGLTPTFVRPQEWQSLMYADPRIAGLEGKARSLKAAKLLCPDINLKPSHRARVDSDGLADAYLIARYGAATPTYREGESA